MDTVNIKLSEREIEILINAMIYWYDPNFMEHTEKEYKTIVKKLSNARKKLWL